MSSMQYQVKYCSVQISELRRRGKHLEEENNALSQQNAKHTVSVETLQHTLEEVILHHGNGSSNEKSEVRTRVLKMTLLWLGREFHLMFIIIA